MSPGTVCWRPRIADRAASAVAVAAGTRPISASMAAFFVPQNAESVSVGQDATCDRTAA